MKKIKSIILAVFVFGWAASCSDADYPLFNSSDTGIYFTDDEVSYSFGVSPTSVTSRTLNLPVRIMGTTSDETRTFTVEIIRELTTATEGTHFRLPAEIRIPAGAVDGIVPLEIVRGTLGETEWQVGLRLVADRNFTPVESAGTEITVTFNNIVTPPNWTSYNWSTGKYVPYWPTQLGAWAPIKYVLFMEYFHAMEESAPSTYRNLVALYGPDLEGIINGWPWDYDYSLKKYILIPMYAYFTAHPELGVSIPNPA